MSGPSQKQLSTYAAVDLGSNSFHMLVARVVDGRLKVLDRIKERVALAEGMRQGGALDDAAQHRALDCLERFNQRLRPLLAGHVRTLGTNTFRRIRTPRAFIRRASNVLGRRIEIVSGHEEARLIYLGVRHEAGFHGQAVLVIDIGGGSTELAHGSAHQPDLCESLDMGCISWSTRYFPDGKASSAAFSKAVLGAKQEIEPIADRVRSLATDVAVASSGTALAISRVLQAEGWSDGAITRDGMAKMRKRLSGKKRFDKVELRGLKDSRRPVIAGGLAIMIGTCEALELDRVEVSQGALREGTLVDLIDREGVDDDPRDQAIAGLAAQFAVDGDQAQRVARTAGKLFAATAGPWELSPEDGRFLRWAALIHELGLAVSHSDYHKHGAYLAGNADLAGFSRDEQSRLAGLIYNHRRKLREERLGSSTEDIEHNLRLALLLRLAVHLHRGRTDQALPQCDPAASERRLDLGMPRAWLADNALTGADLDAEADVWRLVGYQLRHAAAEAEVEPAPPAAPA